VRKLPLIAIAAAGSLAIGGSVVAAKAPTHVLDVPMTDGSIAHIEYVGEVAPKVTITPRPLPPGGPMAFPGFPAFPVFDQMHGPAGIMIRQGPGTPGAMPMTVSMGNLPPGVTSSTTVVSLSNDGTTCTRTTEVESQGPGKPPKVTSSITGKCDKGAPGAPPPLPPPPPEKQPGT
jgi:hypothetical protein